MRIAVIGAAGRTGKLVVKQATERGHAVRALARRPEAVATGGPGLDTAAVDVLDPETLTGAVDGCDAIISTLGTGTSRAATNLYSQGVTNELRAMAANQIRKLAVISAAPAGPRDEQPFMARRVIMPILDRLFGQAYADMRRMEAILRSSELDWIVLRPPRLVDKSTTGNYRIDGNPLPGARKITHADLAGALLDTVGREDFYRRALYVAN